MLSLVWYFCSNGLTHCASAYPSQVSTLRVLAAAAEGTAGRPRPPSSDRVTRARLQTTASARDRLERRSAFLFMLGCSCSFNDEGVCRPVVSPPCNVTRAGRVYERPCPQLRPHDEQLKQ